MPVSLVESHARDMNHNYNGQENHMTAVLDILRASGAVTVGSLAQASTVTFTHRVYNALRGEYNSCIILTEDAAGMADTLADAFSDAEVTDVSVMVCNERTSKGKNKGATKNVKTLVAGIERRNALNANALDETFGNVSIPSDGGIYNESGDLVGFTVEAA